MPRILWCVIATSILLSTCTPRKSEPDILGTCSGNEQRPHVIMQTDRGDIDIEVYQDKAPLSAQDFLYYVGNGLYDGQGFYRVVTPQTDPLKMGMEIIQGGRLDLNTVTPLIDHETTQASGLSHTTGTVSIARSEPGTGSAAFFFISLADNHFLDYGQDRNPDKQGYAAFGHVTKGLDVARAIQAGAVAAKTPLPGTENQFLSKPVIIQKAYCK